MNQPSFSGGILDIPGLVPVNIGSSNPYPVPFAPQIKPQQGPAQATQAPSPIMGVDPGSMATISGFGPDSMGAGTIPSTQNYGDGLDFAFNFGGYGSPSSTPYAPHINPAQNVSSFSGLGLGGVGQSIFDRLSSIGDTPQIDSKNIGQAAVNAGGMFLPGLGALAGILNGFNILPQGETTGNAAADMLGTPGTLQSAVADATNWVNRQFGGIYMPSSYIDPNMGGPPTPDGSPFYGEGQYAPAQIQGPNPDGSAYSAPSQDNMFPGWGGAGSVDYTPPQDNFFQNFGAVPDFGGAGIFNSIGLSPWMTGDMGGAGISPWMGGGGGSYFDTYGPGITSQNNS